MINLTFLFQFSVLLSILAVVEITVGVLAYTRREEVPAASPIEMESTHFTFTYHLSPPVI